MTITTEQVADLRAGDVVRLYHNDDESFTQGPLVKGQFRALILGASGFAICLASGTPHPVHREKRLEIVSRAPRPFYSNHDREHPVNGDVVAWAKGENRSSAGWHHVWFYQDGWRSIFLKGQFISRQDGLGDGLFKLLVDGETGDVVRT